MKLLLLTKAMLAVKAGVITERNPLGLDSCSSNNECVNTAFKLEDGPGFYFDGGCCMVWELTTDMPDGFLNNNPNLGVKVNMLGGFKDIWLRYQTGDGSGTPAAGQTMTKCVNSKYREATKASFEADGENNLYTDIKNFFDTMPKVLDGTDENAKPYASVEAWIEALAGTKLNMEAEKFKMGCKADTELDTNPLGIIPCDADAEMPNDACLDTESGETTWTKDSYCCNTWEALEFKEDTKMGLFGQNWKTYTKEDDFKAGDKFSACMPPQYRDKSMEAAPEGETTNYADLDLFGTLNGVFGEGENHLGKDVDDWIVNSGSTVEDQKAFKLKVGCQLADKLAVSGMLAIGTIFALM
jgi:hypothetical protein